MIQFPTDDFSQSVFAEMLQIILNVTNMGGVSSYEHTHLCVLTCAKLRKAMLLLLGLLGGANSTLLVSSINTLLTYLQVNSTLLFTSNDTIVFI